MPEYLHLRMQLDIGPDINSQYTAVEQAPYPSCDLTLSQLWSYLIPVVILPLEKMPFATFPLAALTDDNLD